VTPFLQFRIWFRRASAGRRVGAALSAAVLVALLVWSAVPSHSSTSLTALGQPAGSVSGSGRSSSGAASGSGSVNPGSVGGSTGGSSGSSSSIAGAGQGSSGATGGSGGDTGVDDSGSTGASGTSSSSGSSPSGAGPATTTAATGTQTTTAQSCTTMGKLRIGIVIPEGAGGTLNSLIGAPPVTQEEADYAAVINSVNSAGGVDCNDLVGDYATDDQLDPSVAQSNCLQFVQDKVFAILGGFLPTSTDDCPLQNHIPTFDQLAIPGTSVTKYYPYYLSPDPTYERLYKNFVGAANQMGFFGPSRHFAKLGIFYRDCLPAENQALISDLAAVGVPSSKISRFDLGCPANFASPTAIEQAVVQFKAAGVTTVTIDNDLEDVQNITNYSSDDDFDPAGGWIVPDDGIVAITSSASFHPNAREFNGAIAITPLQYGAIASNLPETPATQACDKVMTASHLPTVYQSADQFAGSTCSLIWMLEAAIQHGGVSQTGLASGLQAAKSVNLSFPNGPNDFSQQGTTTGGEFWRPVTYRSACGCWQVVSAAWNPSFS
jgi:hypothetical protein